MRKNPGTLFSGLTAQTITFSNITKTYGVADFNPGATASSGLAITYTSNNTAVATITAGNLIHIVGVGTANITATQAGNATYASATSTKLLTVNKAAQTITFSAITKTYGAADFAPSATTTSGLTLSFSSDNTSVATITAGNLIHIVGAGTANITVSQAGDANYNAASVTKLLTVNKANQTITFSSFTKTYGTADFSPAASTTSGLTLTYSSDNTAVGTFTAGNLIHIVGAGTANLTVSQAGDANYNAASVTKLLTVNKANQTITFSSITKTYGTADFSPAASTTSGLTLTYSSDNTAVGTFTAGNLIHIVGAGTANLTVSQAGDANYNAASVTKLLTVNKASQTITFSNITATMGTGDFSPGATTTSGLAITYTSSNSTVATITGSGTLIHLEGGGTANITATQAGDANYNSATSTKVLTVNKQTQTISFPVPGGITYSSPDFSPATASSGLEIQYSSTDPTIINVINGKLHITGVGSVAIIAEQDGNSTYQAASSVTKVITVSKANQTITFSGPITKTYGDEDFAPGATVSSGLGINYIIGNTAIAEYSENVIKIKGAGTTTITAIQPGNSYYNSASLNVNLVVNKASQTILFPTLSDIDYIYPDFTPVAEASSHLSVTFTSGNPAIATIVGNQIHVTGTGTVVITAHQTGNSNYLAAPDVSQNLTIHKATQTIYFGSLSTHKWGDADFDPGAYSTSGLLPDLNSSNTSVATIVAGKIHLTGIGSTTITAAQAGNSNFESGTSVSQILNVIKGDQTITFGSIPQKAIGDADFTLTATASSGLTVVYICDNPAVATIYNGNIVKIQGTGTANITAYQTGNSYYNAATAITQTLVVKSSGQTISFGALTAKTYGDADFIVNATASSGLPVTFMSDNPAVATVSGNLIHITGGGNVNIYALQEGDASYAAATPAGQPLTVNRKAQSITFPALSTKTYLDDPFIPAGSASSGLALSFTSSNSDVAVVMDGKVYITGVGTSTITALQAGNTNYLAATSVIQVLQVDKSAQTITFDSIPARKYGDTDYALHATSSAYLQITYTSSNPSIATIVNKKIHIVGIGTCTITATQSGDDYYQAATSKTRILVVDKASQTITLDPLPAVMYGCDDFEIIASSTSGLQVTYSSSDPTVATISDGMIHVLNAGSTTIQVTQSGNSFYNAANPVSGILLVNKASQVINFDSISPKKYGLADFSLSAFSTSELPVTYILDNPQVAILVDGKVHITGTGTTLVTANQVGNTNYAAAPSVKRYLLINKAVITATPVNATRPYKAKNPDFSCTYSGFVYGEAIADLDVLPLVTTLADTTSYPGNYDLTASGGWDNNYVFSYKTGILMIQGTIPLQAGKPSGETSLCHNPADQTYITSGAIFANSYEWSLKPASAGTLSGTGKTLQLNFEDDFIGDVTLTTTGVNNQGKGATSDTLHIHVLPDPNAADISYRGTYCTTNELGDAIQIKNAQSYYRYQLTRDGENYGTAIECDGNPVIWPDLRDGTYAVSETVCQVPLADHMIIQPVDPTRSKPVIQEKWNDVVVCMNNMDSIESYQWYKNDQLLEGETKQFVWTQKNEGYYWVETMDNTGCIFNSDSLWIDKAVTGEIFPNPNDGNFTLKFNSSEQGKVLVRITRIDSSPVKELSFSKSEELFQTDISLPGLITGTYLIDVLLNGNRVFYQKFIRK